MRKDIEKLYNDNDIACDEDISIATIEEYELKIDIIYERKNSDEVNMSDDKNKSNKLPCIVWIHGGSWNAHELDRKYRPNSEIVKLIKAGFIVVSAEYRLVDESPYPACVYDLKCCIRYIRSVSEKYGIDNNKIYVWGESAGAHLACVLATTNENPEFEGYNAYKDYSSNINGACLWYTPSRLDAMDPFKKSNKDVLTGLLQGDPENKNDRAKEISPYYYVDKNTVPCFLMHGNKDELVDISQSEMLYQRMKECKVPNLQYMVVDGQGHGFFTGERYYKAILDYFKKLSGM